jgi:hypothetical protein
MESIDDFTVGKRVGYIEGVNFAKPAVKSYTVTSATGVVLTLARLLGSTSKFSVLSMDSGVKFNVNTGVTTASIPNGTSKKITLMETDAAGAGYVRPITLNGQTMIAKPYAVTLAQPIVSDGQISISWVDNHDGNSTILSHRIYVNGVGLAPTMAPPPYVLTGLTNGTAVTVQVAAINALGEGALSEVRVAVPSNMPKVSPGAGWTGAAGSGFSTVPTDPTRTTAKPALLPLVPPRQFFVDQLVIGFGAGANNQGSLANLGLSKVIFHVEGTQLEVEAPTYRTIVDANGVSRMYLGWWAMLNRASTTNGVIRVYAEAVPADTTMQSRVMGPFDFKQASVLHDYYITVDSTNPMEVVGSDYRTLTDAMTWLRLNNAQNPLITIAGGSFYDIGTAGVHNAPFYSGSGYLTITATTPVTLRRESYVSDAANYARLYYDAIRWKGSNITIDVRNLSSLWWEGGPNHWLDGCCITEGGGRYSLWRSGIKQSTGANVVRGNAYFTECTITNLMNGCVGAGLVRGCDISYVCSDVFTDAWCVVGNRVNDLDSLAFAVDIPAMTVTYAGSQSTATLSISGGSDATSRTFTAAWGSNTSTYEVGNSYTLYASGSNYLWSHVAAWINGLGDGWSATVLDNTRRASSAGLMGGKGAAFTNANVKGVTLTVASMFDLHSDWYQLNTLGRLENAYIEGNISTNLVSQDLFLTGTNGGKDFFIVNNSFHNKEINTPYGQSSSLYSQFAASHSHMVVAHNSFSQQVLSLRTGQNFTPDAYCLLANNVLGGIEWATTSKAYAMRNNHLLGGVTIPTGTTGTTTGGTRASLFVDAENGNFTPQGELLTNVKPTTLNFAQGGATRPTTAPAGAKVN